MLCVFDGGKLFYIFDCDELGKLNCVDCCVVVWLLLVVLVGVKLVGKWMVVVCVDGSG